jgi:hypothetical protein
MLIDDARVEIVIGWVSHDDRRRACGKAGHYGAMRAADRIANECDIEPGIDVRVVSHRRQRVVFVNVVADQHAGRSFDFAGNRAKGSEYVGALIVNRNDEVELWVHRLALFAVD